MQEKEIKVVDAKAEAPDPVLEVLRKMKAKENITSKEFRLVFGPKMFWDSKNNGTYSYGKNAAKRAKKLKKNG
jgi:hypothetical protein